MEQTSYNAISGDLPIELRVLFRRCLKMAEIHALKAAPVWRPFVGHLETMVDSLHALKYPPVQDCPIAGQFFKDWHAVTDLMVHNVQICTESPNPLLMQNSEIGRLMAFAQALNDFVKKITFQPQTNGFALGHVTAAKEIARRLDFLTDATTVFNGAATGPSCAITQRSREEYVDQLEVVGTQDGRRGGTVFLKTRPGIVLVPC